MQASAPFLPLRCVRWQTDSPCQAEHADVNRRKLPLTAPQNQLIAQLPKAARTRLLSLCEPAPLVMAEVLCEPGAQTRHVYFPTEGFVSLVAMSAGSGGVEVGMVGSEGMVGAQLALGVSVAPLHALVQGQGTAWRIPAGLFTRELAVSPVLHRLLSRYLYVLMIQMATSATCLRFHHVKPRLARWLLMSQDRAHSDRFQTTHEFLGYMLGVRRAGVTSAAGALQREGLIEYHRGDFRVLDRKRLRAAACDCYRTDQLAYASFVK